MPTESPKQAEIREKIFGLVQEYHDAIEDVDKPEGQIVMEAVVGYHTSALARPSSHYYGVVADPNRGTHSATGLLDAAMEFVGEYDEERD